MTLRYWSGFSVRTFSITAGPFAVKSAYIASMNASPSLLREPLGRPGLPGLN